MILSAFNCSCWVFLLVFMKAKAQLPSLESSPPQFLRVKWGFEFPEDITVSVGDTIEFWWPSSEMHDVYIHPSQNCNDRTDQRAVFPRATAGGVANYTFTEQDASTNLDSQGRALVFFVCHVGAGLHCRNGAYQPVHVLPQQVPETPTESPTLPVTIPIPPTGGSLPQPPSSNYSNTFRVRWGFAESADLYFFVGNTIEFWWPESEYHDIFLHPSGNCQDRTDQQGILETPQRGGSVRYTFTESDGLPRAVGGKEMFFACHVDDGIHCQYGVNQRVFVFNRDTLPPTDLPTAMPSNPKPRPSLLPTDIPSPAPTTSFPTTTPTARPSPNPTPLPTISPTTPPTKFPTYFPSSFPSGLPTLLPTDMPFSGDVPTSEPHSTSPGTFPPSQQVSATSAPTVDLDGSIQDPSPTIQVNRNQDGGIQSWGSGIGGGLLVGMASGVLLIMLLLCRLCVCSGKRRRMQEWNDVGSEPSSDGCPVGTEMEDEEVMNPYIPPSPDLWRSRAMSVPQVQ